MFFNEQGILKLDEVVMSHLAWQKIMADGFVTAEELTEQADNVTALLHKVDETFNDEQKQTMESLLAEASVLFAAHHMYQLQEMVKK